MPTLDDFNSIVYLNIECEIILVDKRWLVIKFSSQKISIMQLSLKVRSISAFKFKFDKFALIVLYILGFYQKNSEVYTSIKYKLYLVENLKTNMLIDNNVFDSKSFLINFTNASAYILEYRINIEITTRSYF